MDPRDLPPWEQELDSLRRCAQTGKWADVIRHSQNLIHHAHTMQTGVSLNEFQRPAVTGNEAVDHRLVHPIDPRYADTKRLP